MTNISPILRDKINITSNNTAPSNKTNHQKVYEDLTQHANDVKPNEAKAKLVKETPAQAFVSYFKDLKQDCSNFFKAVKTGKMNDNSLGRINDLGLKAGGLLIASYLASNAKSKTDAVMKFVGGGAFFASMSLWPKLFINLPAKIVHGFDIGQKYISAQGDKKDFFLDNQFLPWDAYSKEELEKIGKHNHIDINSENGKEKIERKMQKVALQNRTLWMATAGFATPLMTALFCDAVEPHIKNRIVDAQFDRVKKYIDKGDLQTDFEKIDDKAKAALEAMKSGDCEIITPFDEFFKEHNSTEEGYFKKLASIFRLDELDLPEEETKAIKKFSFNEKGVEEALESLYKETSAVDLTDEEAIKGLLKKACEGGGSLFGVDDDTIDGLFDVIKTQSTDGTMPTKDFIKTIREYDDGALDITDAKVKELTEKLPVDLSKFKDSIREYYVASLQPTRAKLKLFLKKLNPMLGEVSDSKSTQYITTALQNIIKGIDPKSDTLHRLKADGETSEVLQEFFEDMVRQNEFGSNEYKKIIKEIISADSKDDKLSTIDDVYGKLRDLLDKIPFKSQDTQITHRLQDAVEGKVNDSLFDSVLRKALKEQRTNVSAFVSRAAICANFEARLKDGLITVDGIDLKAPENKDLLKAARKIIYEGNEPAMSQFAGLDSQVADGREVFRKLVFTLFDEEAFKDEPEILQRAARTIRGTLGDSTKEFLDKKIHLKENYLANMNLTQQVKKVGKNMYNNRAWKKIFVPMAAALVGITLLVQPLFGKIDKEFPEKENDKNDVKAEKGDVKNDK